MKTSGFRYLFVIAFAALAVQACAKKDNSLRANKTDKGSDKVTAEGKTTGTKTATTNADGAIVSATACGENPLKMEAAEEGEELVSLEDLMKGAKTFKLEMGTYQLSHVEYFSDAQSKKDKEDVKTNSVYTIGSQFAAPADLKTDAKDSKKITVVCHTSKKAADAKLAGPDLENSYAMPNDINLEDGASTVLRTDTVKISNGDIVATDSVLKQQASNLKTMAEAKIPGLTTVYLAQEHNTFTIRKQIEVTDTKDGVELKSKAILSTTYELKK